MDVLVHQPPGGLVGPVDLGCLAGPVDLEVIPEEPLFGGQCRLDVTWGQCEVMFVVVDVEVVGSCKVDGSMVTSHKVGSQSMDVV